MTNLVVQAAHTGCDHRHKEAEAGYKCSFGAQVWHVGICHMRQAELQSTSSKKV